MTGHTLFETRQNIERGIEVLIALLDMIDGDENLEPYLAGTYPEAEDREEENEHAGDVHDEPHDAMEEGNDEPFLGWSNPRCGTPDFGEDWASADSCNTSSLPDENPLRFDGHGHRIGRKLLRENLKDNLVLSRPKTRMNGRALG